MPIFPQPTPRYAYGEGHRNVKTFGGVSSYSGPFPKVGIGLTENMARKSPDVLILRHVARSENLGGQHMGKGGELSLIIRSGGPDDGSAGDSTVWRRLWF